MEVKELEAAIEGILFAAGDPVSREKKEAKKSFKFLDWFMPVIQHCTCVWNACV